MRSHKTLIPKTKYCYSMGLIKIPLKINDKIYLELN
jgi:hypothetical protein